MIELFEHNKTAYEAVCEQLEETGKACVIHPTGTGKSFIAFKWAEDNENKRFLWLSPSENIFSTQLENMRRASGFEPGNIEFMTYARLANLTDDELNDLRPDGIIFDEAHRAGASVWQTGVERLLDVYPDAQILGLTATPIRYLDNQRDISEELFDGCVADSMTLGEAIARGILPAPKYVVSLYTIDGDMDFYDREFHSYRDRIRRSSAARRERAEEYLEKLRRALEKAEGLDVVFAKHLTRGKYIAFCANIEHMHDMVKKVPQWFGGVDAEPHVYSVWADSPSARDDYAAFRADETDHLRLMFCVDMFNEGIHVENIDGVILFRPTISPIIYKQQIGRALSALKGGTPLIIDAVNNFESLYSISSIREEMREFASYYRNEHREDELAVEHFEIIDEVRECRQLFEALEETLTLSWEAMYQEAKRYRTPEKAPLGEWIVRQRGARNGTNGLALSEQRIKLLDRIGMIWEDPRELTRDEGLRHAEAYIARYGAIDAPSAYVCEDGFKLGRWLSDARTAYRKRLAAGSDPLEVRHLKRLNEMGMRWESGDASFEDGLVHATAYAKAHGTLDIPKNTVMDDGYQLGKWISAMRQRYRQTGHNAPLTGEQIARLEAIGMEWEGPNARKWTRGYSEAAAYYAAHGDLNVPANYISNGIRLWKFLNDQRVQYRKGSLEPDKIARLEAIGMVWSTRNKGWDANYECARRYFERKGDLEIPLDYVADNGAWLGKWLSNQRLEYHRGMLDAGKKALLDEIGMRWERMGRAAGAAKTQTMMPANIPIIV